MEKRTGRPPKGHIFYEGGRWKVRVTCTNGERGTLALDPTFPPHDANARGAKDDPSAHFAQLDHSVRINSIAWFVPSRSERSDA